MISAIALLWLTKYVNQVSMLAFGFSIERISLPFTLSQYPLQSETGIQESFTQSS